MGIVSLLKAQIKQTSLCFCIAMCGLPSIKKVIIFLPKIRLNITALPHQSMQGNGRINRNQNKFTNMCWYINNQTS